MDIDQIIKKLVRNSLKRYDSALKKINNRSRRKEPYITQGKYGIKYYINPNSALDFHIVKLGVMGDWLAQQTANIVPEDGVILDVGANIGLLTTIFAKRYVPRGFVYAYEPDPQNLNQLKINVEINKFNNAIVRPLALQDDRRIKQITLHVRRAVDGDGNENRGLSSIVDLPLHEVEKRLVLASTVDQEVDRFDMKRVDLIKIDVEGAESQVLKGAEKTITRFHPIIQYEYSNVVDRMIGATNTSDCFALLSKAGYRQYSIFDEKALKLLKEPNPKMNDVNVICFWGDTQHIGGKYV